MKNAEMLTNAYLFSSHDINWWTGVVWITCRLLWCFYQVFVILFWRHPFTAEDPLVSKWCNTTFLQSLINISDGHRVSTFSYIFIYGWSIPLRLCNIHSSNSWIGINFYNNNLLKCTRTNIFQKNQCTAAVRLMSVENNRYSTQDDVMKSYCDIPSCSKSERNFWYKLQ